MQLRLLLVGFTLCATTLAFAADPKPAPSKSAPAKAAPKASKAAPKVAKAANAEAATEAPSTPTASKPVKLKREQDGEPVTYGRRPDLMAFGQELATRHNLDADVVRDLLAQARQIPAVARLIMPPPAGVAKNWAAYRARFVEPVRIRAAVQFWQDNATWLERAEQRWGVPPEVIVAVIGVETLYGRHVGTFRVLDALTTLSFDFPSGRSDRSAFFREELEHFVLWLQRERADPQRVLGSFAGAMGLPQFMPSSLTRHAVDFDGDGHINLATSIPDAIGSVANYLAKFGWERGMPTHYSVAVPVDAAARARLLAPDILPSFTATEFAASGAVLSERGRAHVGPLALVELQNGTAAPSFVAGTQNFYAITRYNWSSYYAMAVIDLASAAATVRDRLRR